MNKDIDFVKLAMIQNPNMSPEERAQLQTMAALFGDGEDEEVRGPILWDDAIAVGIVESRNGDPFPGTMGVVVEGPVAGKPTRLRILSQRTIDVRSTRELKRIGSFFERVAVEAVEEFEKAKKQAGVAFGNPFAAAESAEEEEVSE